jgi:hypothetical protein
LAIEILADVEGGSVDGLRPELLLVRPELGLLRGSAGAQTHRESQLSVRVSNSTEKVKGNRRGAGFVPIGWRPGAGAAARGRP